jgi:hypothetical protein
VHCETASAYIVEQLLLLLNVKKVTFALHACYFASAAAIQELFAVRCCSQLQKGRSDPILCIV